MKALKYIGTEIYATIIGSIIFYGMYGVEVGLPYSKGIWNISQVYMWFSLIISLTIFTLVILCSLVPSALSAARKKYQLKSGFIHIMPTLMDIGLIVSLAYFGHIFYSTVWIISTCCCFINKRILKGETK